MNNFWKDYAANHSEEKVDEIIEAIIFNATPLGYTFDGAACKKAISDFKQSKEQLMEQKEAKPVIYPEGIREFKFIDSDEKELYASRSTSIAGIKYQSWCDSYLTTKIDCKIWQVQNKAGEVLTVGDLVIHSPHGSQYKIDSLRIETDHLVAHMEHMKSNVVYNINFLTKAIKSQPQNPPENKNMDKVYILQKDLPDGAKIGDEYKLRLDRYHNKRLDNDISPVIEHNSYFTWQVENNPEFFKPKEERKPILITEDGYSYYDENEKLHIVTDWDIIYERYYPAYRLTDAKPFKEEKNAKKYIEDNKPLFSKKELRDWKEKNFYTRNSKEYGDWLFDELIDSKK